MDIQIPDKLYFKIGEVADLTGVKPHVLRYWESEFGSFRPVKSRSKQRLYRQKDIELVLRLKDLLYNQGFTIAGAKRVLRGGAIEEQGALPSSHGSERALLDEVRRELQALRRSLNSEPEGPSEA
ncbi:MerR family transcriptional regulator [Desulfuromonas sp.]|uniref:MerR family transcriptional regulator n=1 Tax=Desulfuromonas sp. TaxID=892 RepID=UPI0025BA2D58|nr:MerR family transcriptional regulator [Desulfuromonas sp.]